MKVACEHCNGTGEVETCMSCANPVDTCECDSDDVLPEVEMEECPECDGTGHVEDE